MNSVLFFNRNCDFRATYMCFHRRLTKILAERRKNDEANWGTIGYQSWDVSQAKKGESV